MVKITGKLIKQGDGYGIRIKKALIDSEVFKLNTEYVFRVEENAECGIWSRFLSNQRDLVVL